MRSYPILKKLRLSGFLATLDLRVKEAVDEDLSHGEFLFRLLSDEIARRDGKQLDVRLRRASFEGQKRLEDFEWGFNPGIPRAKIIDLATCAFVEKHENVLLVGPTGVGKSHVAQALGERACRAGYSVLYAPAHRMLTSAARLAGRPELREAAAALHGARPPDRRRRRPAAARRARSPSTSTR